MIVPIVLVTLPAQGPTDAVLQAPTTDRLHIGAPKGVLGEGEAEWLKAHKDELLAALRLGEKPPPDPDRCHCGYLGRWLNGWAHRYCPECFGVVCQHSGTCPIGCGS